jgi:hypothetical protein
MELGKELGFGVELAVDEEESEGGVGQGRRMACGRWRRR